MHLLGPDLPAVWDYTLRYQRQGKVGGVDGRCYSRELAAERVMAALISLPSGATGAIEQKGAWDSQANDRPFIRVTAIVENGTLRWVGEDDA